MKNYLKKNTFNIIILSIVLVLYGYLQFCGFSIGNTLSTEVEKSNAYSGSHGVYHK